MNKKSKKIHIEQNEPVDPRFQITNMKLKPTDEKILVSLALSGQASEYELFKGSIEHGIKAIASQSAVRNALHRLNSSNLITRKKEEGGRGRIWSSLTLLGLITTFTLDKFWEDRTNITNLPDEYVKMLPLLLGKWAFHQKTIWKQFYIGQFQRWAEFILREMRMDGSLINQVENPEEFKVWVRGSYDTLSGWLKVLVSDYPDKEQDLNEFYDSIENRYTGFVLNLINITDMNIVVLPSALKRLCTLKEDPEIRDYINKYFSYLDKSYELKQKRLSWWINTWKMM